MSYIYLMIIIALFLLVLYAVICGGDAVKKFTVIGFIAVVLLFIILIGVSFKNLSLSLISKPRFNLPFFETVAKYLIIIFVASAEALIFQRKGGNKKSLLKSTVLGIAIGGALLTLVIANSVLVFGEGYAAEIKFPYTSAVSTFSVGTLFTRLDGFAYFIVLTVNFLKGTLCILSCEYLLTSFKIKHRKITLFVLCGISSDGKIVGTKVIADQETDSYDAKVFPAVQGTEGAYKGMDLSSFAPYLVSGATLTSKAYGEAVKAALQSFTIAN